MRSPVLPLTWHLARSSGRRGLQSHLLSAAAAAVGALVLLLLLAATLGAGTRADRTAWRTPDAVPAKQATAVQTLGTMYVGHEPITVVSLAQLPNRRGGGRRPVGGRGRGDRRRGGVSGVDGGDRRCGRGRLCQPAVRDADGGAVGGRHRAEG
ncbi:hypothetical protein PV377_18700, partial [Streptomyces ipomoeae]|nr:hypothetical protein [Streptomyces ipomoeae]